MCLVPEVVDALDGKAAVLAAGGIGTGRQVAAALAPWRPGRVDGFGVLTAAEYDLGVRGSSGVSVIQEAMLAATSSDTVRRIDLHAKACATAEVAVDGSLGRRRRAGPLPMPLQNILVTKRTNA